MKNKSYIGETIRNAIKASTLTDKEISEGIGVTRLSIYNWKTGKTRRIHNNNLEAISNLLNKTIIKSIDGFAAEFGECTNEEHDSHYDTNELVIRNLLDDKKNLTNKILNLEHKVLELEVELKTVDEINELANKIWKE